MCVYACECKYPLRPERHGYPRAGVRDVSCLTLVPKTELRSFGRAANSLSTEPSL